MKKPLDQKLSNKIANLGFVAAVFVVFIHLAHVPETVGSVGWAAWYFIRNVIAGTAVPFFFLVSGYFLARHVGEMDWWRTAVLKRMRTLLVPLFIWCFIPFVLFTFLWPSTLPGGECGRCELRFGAIATAFGLNLGNLPGANRVLWYVRGLFFLVLVSPLVARLVDRLKGWALLIVFVIYWTLNPGVWHSQNFWLPGCCQVFFRFVFPVEGLFYFTAGFFLWKYPLHLSRRSGLMLGVVGAVLGLASLLVRSHGIDDCEYLSSASLPFTLACLWSLIPSAEWSKLLVGNAFALYVIHPIVVKSLAELQLLPSSSAFIALEWMLVVVIALAAAILLRKLASPFADLAFGGR